MILEKNQPPNPYAVGESVAETAMREVIDFREIVRSWEKLRLWYNVALVLLVLVVVLVSYPNRLLDFDWIFWTAVIGGAMFANVCYLAGAAVEAYGRFLGIWNRGMTWSLFAAGTLFAGLLAAASIIHYVRIVPTL